MVLFRVQCKKTIEVVGFHKNNITALLQCIKEFLICLLALHNDTHLEVNNLICCQEETINFMYFNDKENLLDNVDDLCNGVFSVEEIQ